MIDIEKEFKKARLIKTQSDIDFIDMNPNLQNYIRQGKYPSDADEKSFIKSNKCTFCNNPASKQFIVKRAMRPSSVDSRSVKLSITTCKRPRYG